MADQYVANLKQLPPDKLASKKDEAKHIDSAFQFLVSFKVLPASFGPKADLEKIIKVQRWDKR
jgi:hypothetical protein